MRTSSASRLSREDRQGLRELTAALETFREGEAPALSRLLPQVGELFGTGRAMAAGFEPALTGFSTSFLHATGLSGRLRQECLQWLGGARERWSLYDPIRPEPAQRNRVVDVGRYSELLARLASGKRRGLGLSRAALELAVDSFRRTEPLEVLRAELFERYQLRTLICSGPVLLAWVGVVSDGPFTLRERRLLESLVPALRRRLETERLLGEGALALAALDAALESVSSAAFVLDARGRVRHANSAGRQLLMRDRFRLERELLDSVRHAGAGAGAFRLTRLRGEGLAPHFLATRSRPPGSLEDSLGEARRRWALTPRQAEVLGMLARGMANKTIAAHLGRAVNTVELHVTQLLRKAGVSSRGELVAALWRLP